MNRNKLGQYTTRLKALWHARAKLAKYTAFLMLGIVSLATVNTIVKWHDHYQIHFESPVEFKPLVYTELRKLTVINEVLADQNNTPLNDIQQYICNKFGKDCVTALSIARAESNYNCNEINVNSNGTVDFSVFQENSVHLNHGFTLADLSDCKRMVDRAYELYQKQGFTPWSSYVSGAYKQFLINK